MANTSKSSRSLLAKVATQFDTKPFIPHPVFKQADAQTIGAPFWPERFRPRVFPHDKDRLFKLDPGGPFLGLCPCKANGVDNPRLVMWIAMKGSTAPPNMRTTDP